MRIWLHRTFKISASETAGVLAALGLIMSLVGLGSPSAHALGQTLGLCSASIPLHLSPGVQLLVPTAGTNQSFGETGTLSCAGTFEGYPIAGPGTVGFKATYTGTCAAVAGGGTWSFSIPVTMNGSTQVVHRAGTYNGPSVGTVIYFNGNYPGGKLTGTGLVTPVEGNCLTAPMTKATFTFVGLKLSQ